MLAWFCIIAVPSDNISFGELAEVAMADRGVLLLLVSLLPGLVVASRTSCPGMDRLSSVSSTKARPSTPTDVNEELVFVVGDKLSPLENWAVVLQVTSVSSSDIVMS